jgi:triphosphoribosyl-dephospho-CoA synthase
MVAARTAELENALLSAARPEETLVSFRAVDSDFKAKGINPGTTADLTVACVLAAILDAELCPQRSTWRGAVPREREEETP